MKKLSLLLLTVFVLLANSACSSIPIRDITLYWPMGDDGAVVTHTLTDEESRMTKAEWDAKSREVVAMSYEDFALNVRAVIEKLCSEHKTLCKKDEADKKVADFSRRTRLAATKARRRER